MERVIGVRVVGSDELSKMTYTYRLDETLVTKLVINERYNLPMRGKMVECQLVYYAQDNEATTFLNNLSYDKSKVVVLDDLQSSQFEDDSNLDKVIEKPKNSMGLDISDVGDSQKELLGRFLK